jgi:hypothetical protein
LQPLSDSWHQFGTVPSLGREALSVGVAALQVTEMWATLHKKGPEYVGKRFIKKAERQPSLGQIKPD